MRNASSLPWWGWALIAFFVLNVLLRMDVGIFVPLVIGMVAAGVIGRRRGLRPGGDRPGQGEQPSPQQPLPPVPTDPTTSEPSPWVHGSGQRPGATPTAGTSGPSAGMPRIEVPPYPHGVTPPAAHPASGASPSTDPVVSLGQLHLSRGARDLHAAATAGSSADVARLLAEVGDQADRLLAQLGGAGALPGSGRREFEAGLRRLQRDVAAARGEDPPGAKVARVVRAAGGMGQTGRYE